MFGSGTATYAEDAVLSYWAHKPAALPFVEAAGYPIPTETAIRILNQVGVQSGQTLLVSGAAGGVGSATVQIARHHGITVVGTASAAHQDYLRSLGATATTYGEGLVDRIRALAPDGIDAVLDLAGSGIIPGPIALTGKPSMGALVCRLHRGATRCAGLLRARRPGCRLRRSRHPVRGRRLPDPGRKDVPTRRSGRRPGRERHRSRRWTDHHHRRLIRHMSGMRCGAQIGTSDPAVVQLLRTCVQTDAPFDRDGIAQLRSVIGGHMGYGRMTTHSRQSPS